MVINDGSYSWGVTPQKDGAWWLVDGWWVMKCGYQDHFLIGGLKIKHIRWSQWIMVGLRLGLWNQLDGHDWILRHPEWEFDQPHITYLFFQITHTGKAIYQHRQHRYGKSTTWVFQSGWTFQVSSYSPWIFGFLGGREVKNRDTRNISW